MYMYPDLRLTLNSSKLPGTGPSSSGLSETDRVASDS